ncbi:MAG: hypothetical protein K6G22_04790 [Lachnospiraceae bacterium]|nr:hypothetical protein [Lachnospiraceae bacterium]
MAINGLGQFDIMASYESLNRIPRVNPSDIAPMPEDKVVIKDDAVKAGESLKIEESKAPELRYRGNASIEDISLSFNYDRENAMNGADSDINSLDMEKIVSDAKKDSILSQYQYFVGDSFNIEDLNDGIVIAK